MLIRIIKTVTLSKVGTFTPGMVANIPRAAADNWIANGSAMVYDGKPWVAPPEERDIPKGMFWCEAHQCLHKTGSKPGKVCQKRIDDEAEAREARKATATKAAEESKAKAIEEAAERARQEEGGEEEEEEEEEGSED